MTANPHFRFTAKLWRGFTHERNATADDEKLVKTAMNPLVDAGPVWRAAYTVPEVLQNTIDNREHVAELERRFRELPLVLEVRHRSWADESVLDFLAEIGIGFCNIDQPLLSGKH